jgi:hypothetical protein
MGKTGWGDPDGSRKVCLCLTVSLLQVTPEEDLQGVTYIEVKHSRLKRGRAASHSLISRELLHTKDTLVDWDRQVDTQVGLVFPRPWLPNTKCAPSLSLSPLQAATPKSPQEVTYAQLALRQGKLPLFLPVRAAQLRPAGSLIWCQPPQGDHESSLLEGPQRTWNLPWWILTDEPHITDVSPAPGASRNLWV